MCMDASLRNVGCMRYHTWDTMYVCTYVCLCVYACANRNVEGGYAVYAKYTNVYRYCHPTTLNNRQAALETTTYRSTYLY